MPSLVSLFPEDKSHGLIPEDPLIHQLQIRRDQRGKLHLLQNVLFKVNARRDLCDHQPFRRQFHYTSLADKQDLFSRFNSIAAGESDLLHFLNVFNDVSVLYDVDPAVLDADVLLSSRGKDPAEADLRRVLGNINEPAGTRNFSVEL